MSETTAVCWDCSERMDVTDLRQHMADMHGVMHAPYGKGQALPPPPKMTTPHLGEPMERVIPRFVREASVTVAWIQAAWDRQAQFFEEGRALIADCRAEKDCTECTETQPCERAQRLLSGASK